MRRRTGRLTTTKSESVKGAGCESGGRAPMAVEPTSGDSPFVRNSGPAAEESAPAGGSRQRAQLIPGGPVSHTRPDKKRRIRMRGATPHWPRCAGQRSPERAQGRMPPRQELSRRTDGMQPEAQGVVRCEVESEGPEEKGRAAIKGQPVMNRSAEDGAGSSRHHGGEAVPVHPSCEGVCERHGTEDPGVTSRGLGAIPGGTG